MALPALETTSPLDWRYTAEGGANLVLSFVGPRGPFTGKLLRLRKRKLAHATGFIPDEVDVEFGQRIIRPLLGDEQVVAMDRMVVFTEWLAALKHELDNTGVRPALRQLEDELDERAGLVVLAEDLVHGEGVLAVEIKPKWGFLPSPTFLSAASRDVKTTYCRFCMHRYLKSCKQDPATALDEHQDGYCPLDLYSGDETRVARAVSALWKAWEVSEGAANNLRFFYEGTWVEPTDPAHLSRLQAFLLSTIPTTTPLDTSLSESPPPHALDLLLAVIVPILIASPLLRTLSTLQATLDSLDIEGISSQLNLHLVDNSKPPLPVLASQPALEEWMAWLAARSEAGQGGSTSTKERELLLSYLLSATFKDCSIFIRLAPSAQDDGGTDKPSCSVSVKAIDLDPKPLARLPQYFEQDRKIWSSWKAMLEQRSAEGGGEVRKCVV